LLHLGQQPHSAPKSLGVAAVDVVLIPDDDIVPCEPELLVHIRQDLSRHPHLALLRSLLIRLLPEWGLRGRRGCRHHQFQQLVDPGLVVRHGLQVCLNACQRLCLLLAGKDRPELLDVRGGVGQLCGLYCRQFLQRRYRKKNLQSLFSYHLFFVVFAETWSALIML